MQTAIATFAGLAPGALLGFVFGISSEEFNGGMRHQFRSSILNRLYHRGNPLTNIILTAPIAVPLFFGLILAPFWLLKQFGLAGVDQLAYFSLFALMVGAVVGAFVRLWFWRRHVSRW